MTNEWGRPDADRTEDRPPTAEGVTAPTVSLETEDEVRRNGLGGRTLAGILGVVLLVGGTLFAVAQAGSAGPGTAEAAVADLLAAASDEDVLGVLAALDPGERDALRRPVEDLFAQLERLEVVDGSFRLDGVPGLDLTFEGLTYRTEAVRDGLARVYLTGGTVTTGYDTDELPIGDFLSDTIERFGGDVHGQSDTETTPVVAEGSDPVFLVARRGDDGWRVSIGYTIAEHARIDSGRPLPAGSAITPVGAPSPEAAVEELARAAADLDLRGVIARLAPGELGALQEYAGLFIDDAEEEIAAEAVDVDVRLGDLELRADTDGDRAKVYVDGFSMTVVSDGSTLEVSVADSCVTVGGDLDDFDAGGFGFEDGPVCGDDLSALSQDSLDSFGFDEGEITPPSFPPIETPDVGITTVREDGVWYVAPLESGLDTVVAGLEVIDRSHLEAAVDFVEQLINAFTFGFSDTGGVEQTFADFGDEIGPANESGFEGDLDDLGGATGNGVELHDTLQPHELDQLEMFVAETVTTEPEAAQCITMELWFRDPRLVRELLDAHLYGVAPMPEAQEALDIALEVCGLR